MESLTLIIKRAIQSDTSVHMDSVRRVVQKSKFLSMDKRMKYIFQMLNHNSMWVSVKKSEITSLIFPAFYIESAAAENSANSLVLVTKNEDDTYILYDLQGKYTNKKVGLTHFVGDEFTFFLFEKKLGFPLGSSEKQHNASYSATQYLWLILPILMLIFLLLRKDYLGALIGSVSFLGTYIFYSLLKHHFTRDSNFISAICNTKNSDSCTKVLSHKILNYSIFDFKLLGLVYFLSLSLTIIISLTQVIPPSVGSISFVIILGVLGVLYSLYLQIFKIKAFCKVCLISSFLILLNTYFFLVTAKNEDWAFINSLQGIVFAFIASLISFLFYNILETRASQHSLEAQLIFFKSDTDIFKRVLAMEYENNIEKQFGNQHFEFGAFNAENTLGLIISLNCQHCYHALGKLLNIIEDSSSNKLKIWVASNDNPTQKELSFLNYLIETNLNYNYREFYKKLGDWYIAKDKPIITSHSVEDRFVKGIHWTPVVLIDNKILPHFYSITDLEYLIC